MAYSDPVEPLLALEQQLRDQIALRLALERGEPAAQRPTEDQLAAADAAIDAWRDEPDSAWDPRAFRPQTPLQTLLAEHDAICTRIFDWRDRSLS